MPSSKTPNGSSSHFPQKLKNFFRINSLSSSSSSNPGLSGDLKSDASTNPSATKSSFRQSKFFSVGRLRSTTVASEGNPLDDAVSPTANANPYFAHQGHPGLRHHNNDSVPPSPPDTPSIHLKVSGPDGAPPASTKEELTRKLRRVASAPNAQGLFKNKGNAERPQTAELGKEPLVQDEGSVGLPDSSPGSKGDETPRSNTFVLVTEPDGLGALPPPHRSMTPATFRRTYSSSSIKVRDVEVGPQSFDKIKLIGKGDVGKVYLVREKKSNRLYAMKGAYLGVPPRFQTS